MAEVQITNILYSNVDFPLDIFVLKLIIRRQFDVWAQVQTNAQFITNIDQNQSTMKKAIFS